MDYLAPECIYIAARKNEDESYFAAEFVVQLCVLIRSCRITRVDVGCWRQRFEHSLTTTEAAPYPVKLAYVRMLAKQFGHRDT